MPRGRFTRKLARVYAENMYVRLSRWSKPGIQQLVDSLCAEQEMCFREASHQCARLGADPVEYVAAQFEVFDAASNFKGRTLLPKPCHLKGPGALDRWGARYERKVAESCAEAVLRAKRSVPGSEGDIFDVEAQHEQFFREERKLNNLSRVTHLSEEVIFERFPSEFSRAFIASRAS